MISLIFFLNSSMVLGLLNQLDIFSQLYLIKLVGVLAGLGLIELWHLIYLRVLTGFGMLVFFTNLSLMELLNFEDLIQIINETIYLSPFYISHH